MERTIYLVDNMVICSKAISPYIMSEFFKENVWIIDEVVYEARRSKSIGSIRKLQHSIEAKECEKLKQVARDCVEKYKILSLYDGCADAILLATALAINDSDDEQTELQFDYFRPIIVTQEKGIRNACDLLDIQWIPQTDFVNIVKRFSNAVLPLGV